MKIHTYIHTYIYIYIYIYKKLKVIIAILYMLKPTEIIKHATIRDFIRIKL